MFNGARVDGWGVSINSDGAEAAKAKTAIKVAVGKNIFYIKV